MVARMTALTEPRCPKCLTLRSPGALECPRCGVIYARYVPHPAPPAARSGQALASSPAAPPPAWPPPASASRAKPPRTHVPLAQQELFFFQVAEMLEAGLSQRQALLGGLLQTLPRPFAESLRRGAEQDLPLSENLAPLRMVDTVTLALLRAGEHRGALPQTLRNLAQRIARIRADRRQFLAVLAYPLFIAFAGALIRPVPLLFTSNAATYLRAALPPTLCLIGLLVAYLSWPRLSPDSPLRTGVRQLGRQLPLVGRILRDGAISTFAEVLGSSLAAGLPATEAVELAARATPTPSLQRAGPEMVRRLREGASLTEAVSTGELPPIFLAQLHAAETSGTLDQTLPRLAKMHHDAARNTTGALLIGVGTAVLLAIAIATASAIINGYSHTLKSQEQLIDNSTRE